MPIAYKWRPITDFNDDPKALTEGELEALKRVWSAQKAELAEGGGLDEFNQRLRREWAIETGIIENVYSLDRGTTRTLIEKGIDAALIPHGTADQDSTLVARIIQDHYDTLETMFDFVGGQRQLSTSYIKELHAAMLRNQQTYTAVDQLGRVFEKHLSRGEYKSEPNSPRRPDGLVHEYCPPEHTAAEMDRLVAMHAAHEERDVPVEVEAAWLHHRFSQIHPFADGNGRVARAIASLVFIKADWFPLIIRREDRARYIEGLEKADAGDLRPLVAIFVEAQRNAVIQATELAYDVKPITTEEEAVAAVRDRLVQRGVLPVKEWLVAKTIADGLRQFTMDRLSKTAIQLQKQIGSVGTGFSFRVIHEAHGHEQLRDRVLRLAGQTYDLTQFNEVIELAFNAARTDQLVISFHALGPRFRGIIGIVAYLSIQNAEILLPDGTFQINYAEEPDKARERFSKWLERIIVEGLNAWRATL